MALRRLLALKSCVFTIGRVEFYRTTSICYKIVEFNLSDIGEGIREVTIRDWFVKAGQKVSQFDDICLVESDKASVNITSRFDGIVSKLHYEIGEVALVGKPLVDIDVGEESGAVTAPPGDNNPGAAQILNKEGPQDQAVRGIIDVRPPEEQMVKLTEGNRSPEEQVSTDSQLFNRALATPAVRRIAKENDIVLSCVQATGKGGRVLKEDILRHMETKSIPPTISSSTRTEQITGIKKAMVKTMTKSGSIPTFGYCDDIDMTKLVQVRKEVLHYTKEKGVSITFMPFFIKALSKAIEVYPELNATVDDTCENITYSMAHNIGVAIDTKAGLIVPNVKNVERLSLLEVDREVKRLVESAREMRVSVADMAGGTISISNIGVIGGTYLRPLILPPQVCILAVGKAKLTPTIDPTGQIVTSHIMNASWAADHRIIDGAIIARFSNLWKTFVENPIQLLVDL